ncbi:MAG: hypothetical protein K5919_06225, partial [Clostridiales bacterium]|nr:hypothetical protein [Clostridiales bacterium]
MNSRGFCRAEYTWDRDGNLLAENYYGTRGEPVNTDLGYAAAVYTYVTDSLGNTHTVTEDRFAADGSRADIEGSYSYRRCSWSDTLRASDEYFNASGRLTRPTGGYAQCLSEIVRSKNEVTITTRYLDANGKPLIGSEGGAKIVSVFISYISDGKENKLLQKELLGMELSTGAREAGETEWLLLTEEIYGTDGNETLGAKHWHRLVNTYDDHYNLTRVDYYGTDQKPIMGSTGYASLTAAYDAEDRLIKVDYLDREGRLVKMLDGYARITYTYYSDSRLHTERYYGADGNPTM